MSSGLISPWGLAIPCTQLPSCWVLKGLMESSPGVSLCVYISLSYETQASLDCDPSRKPYFKLITSLKALFSKCHHILCFWKLLSIQHMNWAGRHSLVSIWHVLSLGQKPPAPVTRLSNVIWVWAISVFLPFNCNSCLFVPACIHLGDF